MKILILAQSRSGSNSLAESMIKATNYNYLQEPFNHGDYADQTKIIKDSDDIIVKIVDNHFYKIEEFHYYKSLTSHFDRVIGLTRKDDQENARSRQIAEKLNSWYYSSKSTNIENVELNDSRLSDLIVESKRNKEEIKSFDIFQVTYEGLFIEKTEWEELHKYLGFSIKQYISFRQ
jgi:hypothetical protein